MSNLACDETQGAPTATTPSRPTFRIATPTHLGQALERLHARQDEHPLWNSPLLLACREGVLKREDYAYIFGQYYLYSKHFTRYLAALMANCESDYFRARLSENLWDEGGGCDPSRRHSQLLRDFLGKALGTADPEAIEFAEFTQHFARSYLEACRQPDTLYASAFLSLGTEGIVPRLYSIFVDGLRHAGVAEDELEFFRIHMACDDQHALTLEEMVLALGARPGWYETCLEAMEYALALRARFFYNLFRALQQRRLENLLERIQTRRSLARTADSLAYRVDRPAEALYDNEVTDLGIQFSVDRLPFPGEVLDPRILRIPPGKRNERHRHPHETLMYVVEGSGTVSIDEREVEVTAGDTVFIPRWALHQTHNRSALPLTILAVTDFRLTHNAFVGDAERTTRMKAR